MQYFTPKQYLEIDIANSWGLDKESWATRLGWFNDNRTQLESDGLEEIQKMAHQAEEPAQFYAGVLAYRDMLAGKPIGYLCGLDATASGIQLLSVLSGCPQSAGTCNLVNHGQRADAYTLMHQYMDRLLNNNSPYDRKSIKAAGMTHFYGSRQEPKKAFGEDTPELEAFYRTINDLLPGADILNHDLLALWQSDAYAHEWTLPDGYDVKIKVMVKVEQPVRFLGGDYTVIEKVNQPKESGLSMGANIVHSLDAMVVREMVRRCSYDWEQLHAVIQAIQDCQPGRGTSTLREKDLELLRVLECADVSGFMSSVVIEYVDEHNIGHLSPSQLNELTALVNSMPDSPFHLVCIHDCFKFHANYGNDVRQQYINILAQLADSEALSFIASQVVGKHVPVTKISNNLANHILRSEYALS